MNFVICDRVRRHHVRARDHNHDRGDLGKGNEDMDAGMDVPDNDKQDNGGNDSADDTGKDDGKGSDDKVVAGDIEVDDNYRP